MCFAISGLPAVIDTSLPHGYKKSEPYKASYSPDWNGCGQKATAVRPRLCIPVSVMVLISATANPGSSACCAAVLQGITRRLAPTGGVLGCRPWNHCPKKALTPPAVGLLPPGQLMSSTGRQVTGSFRWPPGIQCGAQPHGGTAQFKLDSNRPGGLRRAARKVQYQPHRAAAGCGKQQQHDRRNAQVYRKICRLQQRCACAQDNGNAKPGQQNVERGIPAHGGDKAPQPPAAQRQRPPRRRQSVSCTEFGQDMKVPARTRSAH